MEPCTARQQSPRCSGQQRSHQRKKMGRDVGGINLGQASAPGTAPDRWAFAFYCYKHLPQSTDSQQGCQPHLHACSDKPIHFLTPIILWIFSNAREMDVCICHWFTVSTETVLQVCWGWLGSTSESLSLWWIFCNSRSKSQVLWPSDSQLINVQWFLALEGIIWDHLLSLLLQPGISPSY